MSDIITITFGPPVPCATLIASDRRCGREATVGTLFPMGDGQYILLPVCKSCTIALMLVYAPDDPAIGGAGRPAEPAGDPERGWTCPSCGRVSYHPKDRENRYCGACDRFFPEYE